MKKLQRMWKRDALLWRSREAGQTEQDDARNSGQDTPAPPLLPGTSRPTHTAEARDAASSNNQRAQLAQKKASNARFYAKRRANLLCVRCGSPDLALKDDGTLAVHCTTCIDKQNRNPQAGPTRRRARRKSSPSRPEPDALQLLWEREAARKNARKANRAKPATDREPAPKQARNGKRQPAKADTDRQPRSTQAAGNTGPRRRNQARAPGSSYDDAVRDRLFADHEIPGTA